MMRGRGMGTFSVVVLLAALCITSHGFPMSYNQHPKSMSPNSILGFAFPGYGLSNPGGPQNSLTGAQYLSGPFPPPVNNPYLPAAPPMNGFGGMNRMSMMQLLPFMNMMDAR